MSLPNISWIGVRWISLLVGLTLTAGNALAGQPSLAFDFGRTAECRLVMQEQNDTLAPEPKACRAKTACVGSLAQRKDGRRRRTAHRDQRLRQPHPRRQLSADHATRKPTEPGHRLD